MYLFNNNIIIRRRCTASGWLVGKWKKNRRRGALNVIIIWQEDKSKTGEEWYQRFLTCSAWNVFANKLPPGHFTVRSHTQTLVHLYLHIMCALVECTSLSYLCTCTECGRARYSLDRPSSVFFDQQPPSSPRLWGRKHRYWISLWVWVIDLKSLWNHGGGRSEGRVQPAAEDSLPPLFYRRRPLLCRCYYFR